MEQCQFWEGDRRSEGQEISRHFCNKKIYEGQPTDSILS
jgi:hypothetical protein